MGLAGARVAGKARARHQNQDGNPSQVWMVIVMAAWHEAPKVSQFFGVLDVFLIDLNQGRFQICTVLLRFGKILTKSVFVSYRRQCVEYCNSSR